MWKELQMRLCIYYHFPLNRLLLFWRVKNWLVILVITIRISTKIFYGNGCTGVLLHTLTLLSTTFQQTLFSEHILEHIFFSKKDEMITRGHRYMSTDYRIRANNSRSCNSKVTFWAFRRLPCRNTVKMGFKLDF